MELFTIGYEGSSLGTFIQTLHANGIEIVIDVRQVPWSHKRGFSRSSLSTALTGSGLEYIHEGKLGCPIAIRKAYQIEKDWDAYVRQYTSHLESHDDELSRVLQFAAESKVCLLCFEGDASRCHRSLITRAAQRRMGSDLRVSHLVIDRNTALPAR